MKSLYHLYAVLPIIHTKNRKLFFFPFYLQFPHSLLLLLYCPRLIGSKMQKTSRTLLEQCAG